jgi:hypothetical protein
MATTPYAALRQLKRILISGFAICVVSLAVTANPKPEKTSKETPLFNYYNLKSNFDKLQCPDMSFDAFIMAWTGYGHLKSNMQLAVDSILTVIDFSKPSTQERLFVININQWKVVLKTMVAHGRNTGDLYAEKFSNTVSSLQSSLGVFVTGSTYQGKHGYSLQIDGVEKGINDKARERAVVIHGADYVNKDYIEKYGRIGRSFGCPAVSYDISQTFIDLIKNGSCLFLYHPSYSKLNGLASLPSSPALAMVTN